jgi:hypothetical protein
LLLNVKKTAMIPSGSKPAYLTIRLTDAPAVYDAVKITANSPYKDTTLLNIPVSMGQVTHLNSIQLFQ